MQITKEQVAFDSVVDGLGGLLVDSYRLVKIREQYLVSREGVMGIKYVSMFQTCSRAGLSRNKITSKSWQHELKISKRRLLWRM